ncbi:MAG: hypothetical protein V4757_11240 [Pseudomonadota bacterium]
MKLFDSPGLARWSRAAALLVLAVLSTGCATGRMEVEQVYYLAATNGTSTNYFRVKVRASTILGVAEFRQGWFPANSVDALFGNVSEENEGKALLTREKMREQLDESILDTQKQYLAAARNPKTTEAELKALLQAQARVRQTPRDSAFGGADSRLIQYNPGKGLVVYKSDEKLVWVLSSNPDEVIGAIANFSEQEATQKDILKFTEVIIQSKRNEVVSRRASNTVRREDDDLVVAQITTASGALANAQKPAEVSAQVGGLLQLMRALSQGGE